MHQLVMNLNWAAIFVCSIISFTLSAIWFGPKTFYPMWIRLQGRKVPTERVVMKKGETLLMFGGTYLSQLVQVVTLGLVIVLARAVAPGFGPGTGAVFGFVLALGIGGFASLGHRLFGQTDFKIYRAVLVWLVEIGADVISLTIAGAVLGAWV